jgi:hypothetical protein
MIGVDTWRVYKRFTYNNIMNDGDNQKTLYAKLSAELINNTYDRVGGNGLQRSPGKLQAEDDSPANCRDTGAPRNGVSAQVTPTKRMWMIKNGSPMRSSFQERYRVCKSKTMHQCLLCKDDPECNDCRWICSAKDRKTASLLI